MEAAFVNRELTPKITAFWPEDRGTAAQSAGKGGNGLVAASEDQGDESQSKVGPPTGVSARDRRMVDLAIYKTNDSGGSEFELTDDQIENSKMSRPSCLRYGAPMAWNHVIVPIEVKAATHSCAFQAPDADGSIERGTGDAESSRGQMAEYAGKIMLRQQRNFLFSIYVHGLNVYLIRWDRCGAVVSEPFSLAKNAEKLQLFLFRFEKMTSAQ